MIKRIIFTGGSGKAGKHAVPHLKAKGYSILNVDLKPLDLPGVNTLVADMTDSGQVFNALTTHFGFEGFEGGASPRAPDAVVHFAAIPRVLIEPDNKTFAVNALSTYNVIEAATKLGVKKIIIAPSETTYGVCFAEGDKDFHAFPLEEDYDIDPMDSYGLSKVVNEKTAPAFAMRYGADIYALRIGNVIEPHEYDRFPGFIADPLSRKRNAWSYIDAAFFGKEVGDGGDGSVGFGRGGIGVVDGAVGVKDVFVLKAGALLFGAAFESFLESLGAGEGGRGRLRGEGRRSCCGDGGEKRKGDD